MMDSHQNPPTPSANEQVNSVVNQQMFNHGGLFPNNSPVVAPPCFTTFRFPVQIPNNGFNPQLNFIPFPPVNQFNPSPQQQGHLPVHNPMNSNQILGQQLLLHNTIQNLSQLLQLHDPNYAQCLPPNFPMLQNQNLIGNVMSHQNPGFPSNHQFPMSNSNGQGQHNILPTASASVQVQPFQNQNLIGNVMSHQNPGCPSNHQFPMSNSNVQGQHNIGQQLQGNQFLPTASASIPIPPFQNQIPQAVGPQYNNFLMNQIANVGQTQNTCPTPSNFKEQKHGNVPLNVNGGWAESQPQNSTGHKMNNASRKGLKSHKHVKEKFGNNGYMKKDDNKNTAIDSSPRHCTNSEKKVPSLNYTEPEIKQWREARKKNYPTNVNILKKCKPGQTLSDVTNQEAMFHRQQLKEILAKQAELGCEVAEIPPSYLNGPDKQNPGDTRLEKQQYKKGKYHDKRGTPPFKDNRITKKPKRPRDQDSFKPKTNKRETSLLEKLLTQDIKRDKNHLLQVFRFVTLNSSFTSTRESWRFPSVIVREEMNPDAPKEASSSVIEGDESEEEEGEIVD